MIASGSIDVVVSNCVLNLVAGNLKRQLFGELFRVLKPGGRAVISDIGGSDDVPGKFQGNPALWSGCISGALREDRFLRPSAPFIFSNAMNRLGARQANSHSDL